MTKIGLWSAAKMLKARLRTYDNIKRMYSFSARKSFEGIIRKLDDVIYSITYQVDFKND